MRRTGSGVALVLILTVGSMSVAAKTITAAGSTNDRLTSTLAGPAPASHKEKKAVKNPRDKSKIKSPPPFHDPN